jgi:hypothetical protein
MATLSMFYGIIIFMFFRDNRQHNLPHIHVAYQDDTAIFSIPDGEIIEGKMKNRKFDLFRRGLRCHADELMAD